MSKLVKYTGTVGAGFFMYSLYYQNNKPVFIKNCFTNPMFFPISRGITKFCNNLFGTGSFSYYTNKQNLNSTNRALLDKKIANDIGSFQFDEGDLLYARLTKDVNKELDVDGVELSDNALTALKAVTDGKVDQNLELGGTADLEFKLANVFLKDGEVLGGAIHCLLGSTCFAAQVLRVNADMNHPDFDWMEYTSRL